MHHRTLCFFIFSVFAISGMSQTLEAKYKVTRRIPLTEKSGKVTHYSFDYTGFLYRKGSSYISFVKPLYLDVYPTGVKEVFYAENQKIPLSLLMDTIQTLNYISFDSLVWRYRLDRTGRVDFNHMRKFEPGIRAWNFLPDTKEVNGLNCQKATLYSSGLLAYEVWFCPDIPMQAGPHHLIDLPGLIVELESYFTKTTWVLESYTADIDIADNIFWPAEFNQPFKEEKALTKLYLKSIPASNAEKMKAIVQQ